MCLRLRIHKHHSAWFAYEQPCANSEHGCNLSAIYCLQFSPTHAGTPQPASDWHPNSASTQPPALPVTELLWPALLGARPVRNRHELGRDNLMRALRRQSCRQAVAQQAHTH